MSASQRQKREALGRRVENIATLYLRLKGYRILTRRFKCKAGEIDIIARKKDLVVIVEVKARPNLEQAQQSISASSKRRIMAATNVFLGQTKNLQRFGVRYDAIFILPRLKIIHEKNFWG